MNKYEDIVRQIMKYYHLGEFKSLTEVLKENDNLVIKFKSEAGEFVFKEYQRGRNVKRLMDKLDLVANFLGDNPNFPFLICMSISGKYYVELDDKVYTVDKYVRGGEYWSEKSIDRLLSLAKVLAELHSKSKIELSEEEQSKKVHYLRLIERFFSPLKNSNDKSFEDSIINKENKTDFDLFLIDNLFPLVRQEYRKLCKRLNNMRPRKNKTLIHGDLNPYNILFSTAEVVGLIDYESITYDFSEYEVVRVLDTYIAFDSEKGYDLNEIKLFLSVYEDIYKKLDITENEILVYLVHGILELLSHFINGYINNGYDESRVRRINIFYTKLKWISNNEDKIRYLLN